MRLGAGGLWQSRKAATSSLSHRLPSASEQHVAADRPVGVRDRSNFAIAFPFFHSLLGGRRLNVGRWAAASLSRSCEHVYLQKSHYLTTILFSCQEGVIMAYTITATLWLTIAELSIWAAKEHTADA